MKILRLTILALLISLTISCTIQHKVKLYEENGYGGPTIWTASNGRVSVSYYNGQCCCIAKYVLQNLADDSNAGVFDWNDMSDKAIKEAKLAEECKRLKDEEKFRTEGCE